MKSIIVLLFDSPAFDWPSFLMFLLLFSVHRPHHLGFPNVLSSFNHESLLSRDLSVQKKKPKKHLYNEDFFKEV